LISNKAKSKIKPKSKGKSNISSKNINGNANNKGKNSKNNTLLNKKTRRSNSSKSISKNINKSKTKTSSKNNNNNTINGIHKDKNKNCNNISKIVDVLSSNSSCENLNLNFNDVSKIEKKEINFNINEKQKFYDDENNFQEKNKDINMIQGGRKLTDEECLEKMKEKLPNNLTLTKTFITRKLRKRIMINRILDYMKFDITVKNLENSIPKKSGPNNFIKFSVKITSEDGFKINSNLLYFLKDLFITHFIVLKKSGEEKKIIIAGSITKDIIFFLKKICNLEFKEKYSAFSAKVKAFAFYEELVYEFSQRKDVISKNLTEEDIENLLKEYDYLVHMRNCYEDVKKIRINE